MSRYYYNKDYFETIDTENKAYWLGFLYADGCINRYYKNDKLRNMNLEIGLCYKDRSHIQNFLDCIESNITIRDKIIKLNGKEYKSSRVNVCSKKICYDLINLGCTPNKTYTLKFPTKDIVPKQYMRDFIRGYFDGDGCISTSNAEGHTISINFTGMESFLNDLNDFLYENKIIRKKGYVNYYKERTVACSLFIYGKDTIKEVLDYLYKDSEMHLDRKYKKYLDYYKDYQDIDKHGVYYNKRSKKYVSTICLNGKKIELGTFDKIENAIEARKIAEYNKFKQSPSN